MYKTIRRRFRLYRQFETDIWGTYLIPIPKNKGQINIIGRFLFEIYKEKWNKWKSKKKEYIYRIDITTPERKIKKRSWKFLRLKRIRLFYFFFNF